MRQSINYQSYQIGIEMNYLKFHLCLNFQYNRTKVELK